MHRATGLSWHPVDILTATAIIGALAWLLPLALDQVVLFGNQDALVRAAAARAEMILPSMLLLAAAVLAAIRLGPWRGAILSVPAIGALASGELPAIGMLGFALGGAVACGIALSLIVRRPPATTLVAAGALVAAMASTLLWHPLLGVLVSMAVGSWWLSSRSVQRAGRAPTLD